MTASRNDILEGIRRSLGRSGPVDGERAAELRERLANPKRNLVPARADLAEAALVDLFQSMAEGVFSTVEDSPDESFAGNAQDDRQSQRHKRIQRPDKTKVVRRSLTKPDSRIDRDVLARDARPLRERCPLPQKTDHFLNDISVA